MGTKRGNGAMMRRVVPLLVLGYFVAYVDRVNLGVAALTMNKDLGFSQTVFGLGAGVSSPATSSSRSLRTCCCTASAPAAGSPGSC